MPAFAFDRRKLSETGQSAVILVATIIGVFLLVLIVSIGAFIRRKRQRKEEEQSKAKEEEQKQIRELYGKGNGADSIEYNFSRHHKPKWDAVEAGVSTSDFDEYEVPEDPSLPRPRNSTSRLAEPRGSTSRPSSSLLRTPNVRSSDSLDTRASESRIRMDILPLPAVYYGMF